MNKRIRIHKVLAIVSALGVVVALAGCRKSSGQYGTKISDPNATPIKAVLSEPAAFEGKTITIEGRIVRECPTGCWFDVQEGPAIIHVDLNPSGLAIPQKVGKTASVEGRVSLQNGRPMLVGKGVEIK